VIRTSAQVLMQRESLSESQVTTMARVLSNADRIDRMIRDLLDYTRAGRTGFQLMRVQTTLADLCKEVIDSMKTLHPDRIFHFSAIGDTRGEWDRDRIVRVVSNLVTNAVNYGREDSPITIVAKGDGDAVELSIHNEGNPIAPENVPRLFEAFTRAVSEATAHRQGLGLGLFIVKEIVQAHGGTVEVASSAEKGTTFTVRLPRK